MALLGDLTSLDEAIKLAYKIADHISLWRAESAPPVFHSALRSAAHWPPEPYQEVPSSSETKPMRVN